MRFAPLLLAALLGACTFGGNSHRERQLAELRFHRAMWQQEQLRDYQYVLRASCFCDPEYMAPRIVQVRDGRVTSAVDSATGLPNHYASAQFNPTVDSLFQIAERTIADEAIQATVEYDGALHYPTRIGIVRPGVADGDGEFRAAYLKAP
jgi:hypothetical protein